jgi:uncharacterized repeat protein (TIGR04052 family)
VQNRFCRTAAGMTSVLAAIWLLWGPCAHAAGGAESAGMCVGDANGDGEVTIDEIVASVSNALDGCGFVPITVRFKAMVGSEPFACGTLYHNIGTTAVDIIPADLRFYVHNVRLISAAGAEVPLRLPADGIWQVDDLALLDFEDKTPPCSQGTVPTNTTLRGIAPQDDYTGIRFVLGVPFALNHANAALAPSPLNLTTMFWNWQGGYKFLRIDEALDTVRLHLGSTGCEYGSPGHIASCARPNRGEVFLTNFDPNTNTIIVDLAALFADSDLNANDPDTPPGCMSDPDDTDCDLLMRNVGVNFANGMPDPSRQTFFRVE